MSDIFTARTLARHWQCTPQTVYNLRARGKLIGFKLGRLWRITSQEVEAYECQITALDASRGDGASCGRKVDADTDGVFSPNLCLYLYGLELGCRAAIPAIGEEASQCRA